MASTERISDLNCIPWMADWNFVLNQRLLANELFRGAKTSGRTHSWQQLVELVGRVAACDPESQHNFLSQKLKRDSRLLEKGLNGDR